MLSAAVAGEVGMVLAGILFIKRVSETTEVSHVTDQDMLERPELIAQGKEIPDEVIATCSALDALPSLEAS